MSTQILNKVVIGASLAAAALGALAGEDPPSVCGDVPLPDDA